MNFEEKELLQWWLDKDPLTPNEKKLIHSNRPNYLIQNNKYMYLLDEYFDLMPFSHISSKTHTIKFLETATAFINQLFNKSISFLFKERREIFYISFIITSDHFNFIFYKEMI